MIWTHKGFLAALTIRLLVALVLPQTFFQPDEFYQALEPAHRLVFGYGHLTWEWRDLPASLIGSDISWWDAVVVRGRMRGWLWPGLFAAIYKVLQILQLDSTTALVMAPRILGAFLAACTDYATSRLAVKVLGHGSSETALFLSLTSLFNAFVLPRSLSTSPETLLVTVALADFPFPRSETLDPFATEAAARVRGEKTEPARQETSEKTVVDGRADGLDQGALDRAGPDLEPREVMPDNLMVSAACAALAVCLRPTTLPLWAYLGLEHTLRNIREGNAKKTVTDVLGATMTGALVLATSTAFDFAVTGRLSLPILTFIHRNILMDLSSFYGRTNPLYHLTQSLPILLFPIWYWWGRGFVAALLPASCLPTRLASLDRPAPLRFLARATTFTILTLSLSPHSEWRFLHPLLPSLLLFAIPPLFKAYHPTIPFGTDIAKTFRQYCRLNKLPFYLVIFACLIPMSYLGIFHGRAQVAVMNALRTGAAGNVTGLAVLMPCHSTPWMSHLHKDVPSWFLTCEPPLQGDASSHQTQQSLFYSSPVTYIEEVFPYPVTPLHRIPDHRGDHVLPSHVVLFEELLGRGQVMGKRGYILVKDALVARGYHEVWSAWNGFTWAQDELERRGLVKIWAL